MQSRLEVDIQVIVHATEDKEKIFDAFEEVFGVEPEEFSVQNLTGHFDNPITLLGCKLKKKKASEFVKSLTLGITKLELDQILDDLENRLDKSALHLRISKQQLVRRKIKLDEQDPVKIRIYTPIYTQKDIVRTYSEILTQNRI